MTRIVPKPVLDALTSAGLRIFGDEATLNEGTSQMSVALDSSIYLLSMRAQRNLFRLGWLLNTLGCLPNAESALPSPNRPLIMSRLPVRTPTDLARCSVCSMAAHRGVSKATGQWFWAQNDLKPHRTKVFNFSSDPHFEAKFWDVIGLYLNPPERALVFCDEKTQIQALQRSQPGLPLGPGHLRTETHDSYRHGTVALFAALDYLKGKVLARMAPKHTHCQWLDFLKHIDWETPPDLDLHLPLNDHAPPKHAKVKHWPAKRLRFHPHFVPTSSSCNLMERYFRDLSQQSILPGSFGRVPELVDAFMKCFARHNVQPKRYVWRAEGAAVLANPKRAWEPALRTPKEITGNLNHRPNPCG